MATANAIVGVSEYSGMNTIKVRIVRVADETADVVPPQYAAGPFNQYTFFFSPLQRGELYKVLKYEVSNVDHSQILMIYLESFTFIANNYQARYKEPVEWEAGVDNMPDGSVYPDNVSSFTNDDWKGWELSRFTDFNSEYSRKEGYLYDPNTGTLSKKAVDDVFVTGALYKVEFQPQIDIANNTSQLSTGPFSEKVIVTNNELTNGVYTLDKADIGKLILLKATASNYTVQLPALADVNELKITYFEMEPSLTAQTAVFQCASGNQTNWIFGKRNQEYIMPGEKWNWYKEIVTTGSGSGTQSTPYWRIRDEEGNWKRLGEIVCDDSATIGQKLNCLACGSGVYDVLQYARYYNDYALTRPNVTFDNWNLTNNRGYNSQKSAATIGANVNKAHTPCLDGVHIIAAGGVIGVNFMVTGQYGDGQTGAHTHAEFADEDAGGGSVSATNKYARRAAGLGGNSSYSIQGSTTKKPTVGISSNPLVLVNNSLTPVADTTKNEVDRVAKRFFVVV